MDSLCLRIVHSEETPLDLAPIAEKARKRHRHRAIRNQQYEQLTKQQTSLEDHQGVLNLLAHPNRIRTMYKGNSRKVHYG